MTTYEQELSRAVVSLSREIQRIGAVAHRLQEQIRTNQLPYSSLDGTDQLSLTDGGSNVLGVLGQQGDGTTTFVAVNQAPSMVPSTPIPIPSPTGLGIQWDGNFSTGVLPVNWDHMEVHLSTTPAFTPDFTTLQGTLKKPGIYPVAGLSAGITYYMCFVPVDHSGGQGQLSGYASSTISGTASFIVGGTGTFLYIGFPALGNPPCYANIVPGTTQDPYGNNLVNEAGEVLSATVIVGQSTAPQLMMQPNANIPFGSATLQSVLRLSTGESNELMDGLLGAVLFNPGVANQQMAIALTAPDGNGNAFAEVLTADSDDGTITASIAWGLVTTDGVSETFVPSMALNSTGQLTIGSLWAYGANPAVQVLTFTKVGTNNWVAPAGIVSPITVECFGPAGNAANGNGGGGGGGAYAKGTVAVTAGNTYHPIVTAHGSGSQTTFTGDSSQTVAANAGGNASFQTGGSAGSGGTGTTLHSGGAGGNGQQATNFNPGGGGGGGSSAGTLGNGNAGGNAGITTPGSGGPAPVGGFAGGVGGEPGNGANGGTAAGAGGGGRSGSAGVSGGGMVRLTFQAAVTQSISITPTAATGPGGDSAPAGIQVQGSTPVIKSYNSLLGASIVMQNAVLSYGTAVFTGGAIMQANGQTFGTGPSGTGPYINLQAPKQSGSLDGVNLSVVGGNSGGITHGMALITRNAADNAVGNSILEVQGNVTLGGNTAANQSALGTTFGQLTATNPQGSALLLRGSTLAALNTNTVTSGTAYANLTQATIPAADATAIGATYKLKVFGYGTWGSTQQNLLLAIRFGSAVTSVIGTAAVIAAAALAASAAFLWDVEITLSCVSTGVSGTWRASMIGTVCETANPLNPGAVGATPVPFVGGTGNTDIALDTTIAEIFGLSAHWGSSTGAPTLTKTFGQYERVS